MANDRDGAIAIQDTSPYWQKVMRSFMGSNKNKTILRFDTYEQAKLCRPQIYSARETLNSTNYRLAKSAKQQKVMLISKASARGSAVCLEKIEVEPDWHDRRASFTWKDALKTHQARKARQAKAETKGVMK